MTFLYLVFCWKNSAEGSILEPHKKVVTNCFKTGFICISPNVHIQFIFENRRPFNFMFVLHLVKISSCQDIVESFVASFSINQRT